MLYKAYQHCTGATGGGDHLKDKFLTQSVLDIHRKLQTLVTKGSRDLEQLVHIPTSTHYNRDLKKGKERPGEGKEKG
jgi:hypothetical protein